jgi:hypothetical protein
MLVSDFQKLFCSRVYIPSCLEPFWITKKGAQRLHRETHSYYFRHYCIAVCLSLETMAKYLNSSMSFIVNGLSYEPWVRPKVHSNGNICLKSACCHLDSRLDGRSTWLKLPTQPGASVFPPMVPALSSIKTRTPLPTSDLWHGPSLGGTLCDFVTFGLSIDHHLYVDILESYFRPLTI